MPRPLKSGKCVAAGLRRLKEERGSTLVEFAFVFMILMTMILGVIDFSRALYAYHFVSGAARQATRWAAVNGATCEEDSTCPYAAGAGSTDIQNYVKDLATAASIDTSGNGCGGSACLTTTATWPGNADSPPVCATTQNSPGCTVQVQVSYNFNFLIPFIHNSPITLSSSSQMVISH
jgi:Flp pilus assembly protein TadG